MAILNSLLIVLLIITAAFLIILVLIQRGKGGGLAGALGGMGGQSAFGTKAGDLFTKITVGVAIVWIVLCVITIKVLSLPEQGPLKETKPKPGATAPASTEKQPAGGATKTTPAPAKSTPAPAKSTPAPAKTPEKAK
ncbi:MAG: preprotein translocase subunit SecG [Thermoguttaceae bacterium]